MSNIFGHSEEKHGIFEKVAFYGGTALRILYGLDRYSEDLDFTLLRPNPEFTITLVDKETQEPILFTLKAPRN